MANVSFYGLAMKTEEPNVEKARDAEILVIAIDCTHYSAQNSERFIKLRNVSVGMAKKRLLFGQRNDLLGVFKLGSSVTDNNLAKLQEGGYQHIELVFPAVRSSLETVKRIQQVDPETVNFLALDCLEVLGDYLLSFQSAAAKKKRACLFSHSNFVSVKPSGDELSELISTCDLYRKENIRIDIVCADWLDEYDIEDEDDVKHDELTSSHYFERAAELGIPAIWALAHATGGMVISVEDASDQTTLPEPRTKRCFARYRGTLDIGSIVQIPVKAFFSVNETKREIATKLSWAASQSVGKQVGVLVEPQKVLLATDPVALEPEQLIGAYKYGTDLVPVKNQDAVDTWSCNVECSLSTIAFISIESVPVHWLMSAVNAIVPMRDIPEARCALHALVQALHDDDKGILARWVSKRGGGAPIMVFLWPVIEVDRSSGSVKNRFLYASELPLKEDLRDYPFSNLKKVRESLSLEAESAMDEFIDSRMLGSGSDDLMKQAKAEEGEDKMEDEPEFTVSETCNPILDRFYASVVQRALQGEDGAELAPISEWQKKIMDPSSFIAEERRNKVEKSVERLKITLAVSKVPAKEREKKKVTEALSGNAMSISDFLPPEVEDGREVEKRLDGDDDPDAAYLGAAVGEW